jgi:hypothetical protein
MTHEPTTSRLLLQISWLNVRVIPTLQHTVLTVYHPNVQPNASEIKNQHFQCNTFNSSRSLCLPHYKTKPSAALL